MTAANPPPPVPATAMGTFPVQGLDSFLMEDLVLVVVLGSGPLRFIDFKVTPGRAIEVGYEKEFEFEVCHGLPPFSGRSEYKKAALGCE